MILAFNNLNIYRLCLMVHVLIFYFRLNISVLNSTIVIFFFVSLFVYLSIELFFDLREKVRKKDSDEEFVTVECKQFSIDKILR